jgi:hypothetical protein
LAAPWEADPTSVAKFSDDLWTQVDAVALDALTHLKLHLTWREHGLKAVRGRDALQLTYEFLEACGEEVDSKKGADVDADEEMSDSLSIGEILQRFDIGPEGGAAQHSGENVDDEGDCRPAASMAQPSGIFSPLPAARMIRPRATVLVAMSMTRGSRPARGTLIESGLVPKNRTLPPNGAMFDSALETAMPINPARAISSVK